MTKLLLFLLILGPFDRDEVWRGFRGNGDSHSEATRLPLEWSDNRNVAWSAALPGYGQSSPVVWRDRVFLTAVAGDNKERLLVVRIDLKSGSTVWKKESLSSFPMKDSGTVSKAAPTPAVDADRLYAFFESGDLFAFDHSGRQIWRRSLAVEYGKFQNGHGLGSSIALTGNSVIVLIADRGPSYLLAIDRKSGRNIWKTDLPQSASWATPTIFTHAKRHQVLVSTSGRVAAHDIQDGRLLWQVNGLKGNVIPSPSVSGDLAIIGSSEKGANLAVRLGGQGDVTSSHVAWQAKEATANFASPLIHQNRVYFVNKVGVVFCLDLQTGEEIWRERIGGECWASPVAAGDRIYFFTVEGSAVVLRAGDRFEKLAENSLSLDGGRLYGTAVVRGALLLRSGRRLVRVSVAHRDAKSKPNASISLLGRDLRAALGCPLAFPHHEQRRLF